MAAPIVVRNYRAKTQTEASKAFASDASHLSIDGYRPISQSWSAPGFNASAVLGVLGLVCIVGGFLVLLPLLVVGLVLLVVGALIPNPKGELAVTFQRPDRQ